MSSLFLALGDSLRITLSSAADTDVVIFYNGGRVIKQYATAATYDIFDAITSTNIESILVTNKHASTSQNVTLALHTRDGLQGTPQLYPTTTLAAGQQLAWANGQWVAPAGYPSELMRLLTADAVGENVNTAQPWFPSLGAVTVEAAVTYIFDGHLQIVSGGGTTHTTATLFAGTATLTAIDYVGRIITSAEETLIASSAAGGGSFIRGDAATALILNATSTAVEHNIDVMGTVRINAAGTFIPQFQYSADPTGAQTIQRGTWFRMKKLSGTNSTATWGTWA